MIVLEQNAQVGGKMGEITADGFRWDTGPSVITMRPVFEELFAAAGRRLEDYLTLLPVEPLTRYFYPDGTIFDATRDLARMAQQIAALDERDVEGYLAYLAYAARIHRITGEKFIYGDPPTLMPARAHTAARHSRRSIRCARWIRRFGGFVHSPHLRQMLGRFATYVGASPFLAPGHAQRDRACRTDRRRLVSARAGFTRSRGRSSGWRANWASRCARTARWSASRCRTASVSGVTLGDGARIAAQDGDRQRGRGDGL